ncbi:protocadherin-10-like [Heterodontus francisci]|uniref:protocadherin-10-like n=1 Tax=Heterodontus francisci TaxID=7792 RepID=UPI00355C10ED
MTKCLVKGIGFKKHLKGGGRGREVERLEDEIPEPRAHAAEGMAINDGAIEIENVQEARIGEAQRNKRAVKLKKVTRKGGGICVWKNLKGQIRYTIPEELKHGAFVGNVADDLGLDVSKLSARRLRIVSGASKQYLEVNLGNGILFVNEKIDREQLCGLIFICFLHLEVVIENPLELYRIEVEILDVNDNSPTFLRKDLSLDIIESAFPGTRFPLESAQDPDVGTNSIHTYKLSPNNYFILDVRTRSDRSKFAELVLEKTLDREQQQIHQLVLTAVDGGIPERSGTALISVIVLDANDNQPVFEQTIYKISLEENAPKGTLVLKLNASDLDEGSNSEIVYSFSSHTPPRVHELFNVDSHTGEIRVKSVIDHEELNIYEIYIQAKDKGGPYAIPVHCKVLVNILDVNDNAPEVIVTSLSSPVMEDAMTGTVIALISVTDQDSGKNGQINCVISQDVPFRLQSSFENYYTLVTTDLLDRERVSEYNITIMAIDSGYPSLSTNKSVLLKVSDVNDNAPRFSKPSYTVYVTENNAPGAAVCSVTALDPDSNQNAYLSYSILDSMIQGLPARTYVSMNSDNGKVYALRSFDYEQLKHFQIQIQAQDAGFPPLTGTAKVNVIILDQNDNGPVIVSPRPNNGSAALQKVPQYMDPGQLVIKVIATDADSGQNAKLSYRLLQATDPTLFNVALLTGEVRTTRRFGDRDNPKQTLFILVKDNGQTPLSATATIIFLIMDNITEILPKIRDFSENTEQNSALTFYVIIALGSISFVFIVAIIIVATIKCHQYRNNIHVCSTTVRNCCCLQHMNSADILKTSKTNLQVTTSSKVPPDFLEVGGSGPVSHTYYYKVCLTPESAKSDFTFLKPYCPAKPKVGSSNTEPSGVEWNAHAPKTSNSNLSTSNFNAKAIKFRESNGNRLGQVFICALSQDRAPLLVSLNIHAVQCVNYPSFKNKFFDFLVVIRPFAQLMENLTKYYLWEEDVGQAMVKKEVIQTLERFTLIKRTYYIGCLYLKMDKAPGPDEMHPRTLREVGTSFYVCLVLLLACSTTLLIETGLVPWLDGIGRVRDMLAMRLQIVVKYNSAAADSQQDLVDSQFCAALLVLSLSHLARW